MKLESATERTIVTTLVVALAALAWLVLTRMAADMGDASMPMSGSMPMPMPALGLVALSVMWMVMMAAMMLPGTIPVVTIFSGIQRRRRAKADPWVPTSIFLGGYLLVWCGFSVLAAAAQAQLHRVAWLSEGMVSTHTTLSAALLIAAGVYQWIPTQNRCLAHCRSPMGFLTSHWREGRLGAWRLGLELGAWCVGCCWVVMLLLFVGGVMNLRWVALLTAFVAAERLLPRGELVGRIGGVAAIVWGLTLAVGWMR